MDASEKDDLVRQPAANHQQFPTDLDIDERLDWDFRVELIRPLPAKIIDAEIVSIGRAKPIPLIDPSAEDSA
jgi:hypothetical protein